MEKEDLHGLQTANLKTLGFPFFSFLKKKKNNNNNEQTITQFQQHDKRYTPSLKTTRNPPILHQEAIYFIIHESQVRKEDHYRTLQKYSDKVCENGGRKKVPGAIPFAF